MGFHRKENDAHIAKILGDRGLLRLSLPSAAGFSRQSVSPWRTQLRLKPAVQKQQQNNPIGSRGERHASRVASEWSGRHRAESARCKSFNRYVIAAKPTRPLRANCICSCCRFWPGSQPAYAGRVLIFLGMCSRKTLRRDRPKFTRRSHGIAGYQRRKTRLLRIHARDFLGALRDMRDALAHFDKVVKRAIARLPKRGVMPGAVITVLTVMIVVNTSAIAPAAEAADTS